jgi:hypothetical protein
VRVWNPAPRAEWRRGACPAPSGALAGSLGGHGSPHRRPWFWDDDRADRRQGRNRKPWRWRWRGFDLLPMLFDSRHRLGRSGGSLGGLTLGLGGTFGLGSGSALFGELGGDAVVQQHRPVVCVLRGLAEFDVRARYPDKLATGLGGDALGVERGEQAHGGRERVDPRLTGGLTPFERGDSFETGECHGSLMGRRHAGSGGRGRGLRVWVRLYAGERRAYGRARAGLAKRNGRPAAPNSPRAPIWKSARRHDWRGTVKSASRWRQRTVFRAVPDKSVFGLAEAGTQPGLRVRNPIGFSYSQSGAKNCARSMAVIGEMQTGFLYTLESSRGILRRGGFEPGYASVKILHFEHSRMILQDGGKRGSFIWTKNSLRARIP